MPRLYLALAAFHLVAVVVTGVLWFLLDLLALPALRRHARDIRAVHFGSLHLAALFPALAYALERAGAPPRDWLAFPLGLAGLVLFSGLGYLFPRAPDRDPFYYWTEGWPLAFATVGLVILCGALLWTAAALIR